jgi:hypothetical protein
MASSLLPSEGSVGWTTTANNAISAPQLNGFRLSLTGATPVTASDVTSATTIYLTPFTSDRICLFDGTNWQEYSTGGADVSASLGTLMSGKNYDVFVYDNNGSVAIDTFVAWMDDTTRATAIVRQNGVWVKSGAATRRYVGTFRTTSTTATEDSSAKRFLVNASNQVRRPSFSFDTTDSWTNNGNGTWSAINGGNAAWKREFLIPILEERLGIESELWLQGTSDYVAALAFDSSTAVDRTNTAFFTSLVSVNSTMLSAKIVGHPSSGSGVGYHYVQGIQTTSSNVVATAAGDNGGSVGSGNAGVNSGILTWVWC